jgi:hypothetical protein
MTYLPAMDLKKDWETIAEIACEYTNYTLADDEIAAGSRKNELVAVIRSTIKKHGNVPFLLETLADYTDSLKEALELYERAAVLNVEASNFNDALSCANRALDRALDDEWHSPIALWRSRVEAYALKADDKDELAEAKRLLS